VTDPRPGHLDAMTIAAFIDRTLDPKARAAAEAHLADCADCREVWVETSELAEECLRGWSGATVVTPAASVAASRPASRTWIYAGAGLAVAAALVLTVFSPRLFNRSDRPERWEPIAARKRA
jgi:predicted anti-sigma-YlaC factor YlaD